MKTVILGCGYIGKALAQFWHSNQKYCPLFVTTTTAEKVPSLKNIADSVSIVQGNDEIALSNLLEETAYLVVCLAPSANTSYDETYLKTAQTLAKILEKPNKLRQLVYTSTTSVYGDYQGGWAYEDDPVKPENPHAQALYQTEQIYLSQLPSHIKVTILRLAGIYGPGREHFDRAIRMAGKTYPGSGGTFCNWTHQEDVLRAIDWSFNQSLAGIYNVCSDDHPRRASFYEELLNGKDLPPIRWDPFLPNLHTGNKRVSNQKLKDTGFQFRHTA